MAFAQAGILCPNGDSDCGGVSGACKPGLIYEGFETIGPLGTDPRGGTGGVAQANDFSSTIGFIERNAGADSDTTMVGSVCFGFEQSSAAPLLQAAILTPTLTLTGTSTQNRNAIPNEKAYAASANPLTGDGTPTRTTAPGTRCPAPADRGVLTQPHQPHHPSDPATT